MNYTRVFVSLALSKIETTVVIDGISLWGVTYYLTWVPVDLRDISKV